jgi:hypothetical protein
MKDGAFSGVLATVQNRMSFTPVEAASWLLKPLEKIGDTFLFHISPVDHFGTHSQETCISILGCHCEQRKDYPVQTG